MRGDRYPETTPEPVRRDYLRPIEPEAEPPKDCFSEFDRQQRQPPNHAAVRRAFNPLRGS